MMLMAGDSSGYWTGGDASAIGEFAGDGVEFGDELSMDLDTFFNILGEGTDPSQSSPEDRSVRDLSQGESAPEAGNHENSQHQSGFQVLEEEHSLGAGLMGPVIFSHSYNAEASDARTGGSGGSFDYYAPDPLAEIGSPMQTCSASLGDWFQWVPGSGRRVGMSQSEIPNCSATSSLGEGDANLVSDHGNNLNFNILEGETEIQPRHVEREIDSKYASCSPVLENLESDFGYYGALNENCLKTLGAPENDLRRSTEIAFMDRDISSHAVTSTDSTICHRSDVINDFSDRNYVMQYGMNRGDTSFSDSLQYRMSSNFNFQFFPSNNEEIMTNIKDEIGKFPIENGCSSSRMISDSQAGRNVRSVSELPMNDYSYVKGQDFRCEANSYISPICGISSSNLEDGLIDDKASVQPFGYTQSCMSSKRQVVCMKDERDDELVTSRSMMCTSGEVVNEGASRKCSYNLDVKLVVDEDSKQSLSGISPSVSYQSHVVHAKDEKEDMVIGSKRACYCEDDVDGIANKSSVFGGHLNLNVSEQYLPCTLPSTSSKKQLGYIKDEREDKLIQPKSVVSHLSRVSSESIQSNSLDCKSHVDDDSDICILEDISQPAPSNQSLVLGNTVVTSQHSTFSDSLHFSGVVGPRLKANDERLIFRVALQDLSQPKSEASPPDGVLAVPLLRHQRIALSWMVQKETKHLPCSGGILADDQGLGKTISTIALILKERSPSVRACSEDVKRGELETLSLDDDDDSDEVPGLNGAKQDGDYCQVMSNGSSTKSRNSFWQGKGRPAAGTLVVCPTSVLRQWADELHNKVTSKGNLSVLVYHGGNRTKDPWEVAKYDVVLTTYSIVSMEVPKQPLVDKDDGERGKLDGDDIAPMGLSSGSKRKYPPISDKKCSKQKKGMDSALLESAARPLAKVRWFRVVLDEAQSIKNHRTQVARACWGLRAKRRWCLSGTPIQNAIDDLYSYFRFLRYDPYAVYKSFCSKIKVPITKNPTEGYRKLQAVLKTIMLRRTKGTLLDGEPIVTLPPKVVELKKVDFTEEEREFYSRLETDSRAQFKEYADAGTVKQNYVNILLMLLRLRQACDHPLLVKGFDSISLWRSSVEMAKKLSREKQICLLNCLEASLAICGICNDPPEDAVVSVCGHVFCNQCICEHLTGYDKQCPATNCKVQLSVCSVFSKATLNSSLSEQPGRDNCPNISGSELVEAAEPCSEGCSYDSSKIKAALEVLQSLAKPQDCPLANSSLQNTFDGNNGCHENSSNLHAGDLLNDSPDKRNLVVDKSLNDSNKVVGEKAIVFSQWTRMLDLLEACLKNSSIQYRRLDGTMSVVARDKAVKDFNTLPEVTVMIMSLKAASLGLNMVAACHVVLLDLWWNPTTEDQAIDRAHRIGQTRPVSVLRLTVKDTVEDRILALQQKKREMVASAFGEDESGSRQTRLTVEDLKYLFMA